MNLPETKTSYDTAFFDAFVHDARRSADVVLPILLASFPISSVVDFGCGTGEWLSKWQDLGVNEVVGIDGDYVDRDRLAIAAREFIAHDLCEPIDLGQKFDLVECLEVAEHLPASAADQFVDMLTAHGDCILFSAAVPGQMGIQHINEQPHDYWREKFERRGFVSLDWIRPQVKEKPEVASWYRYNTLLFVERSRFQELPDDMRSYRITVDRRVPDVSPLPYRLRRSVTRWLPVSTVDWFCQRALRRKRMRQSKVHGPHR